MMRPLSFIPHAKLKDAYPTSFPFHVLAFQRLQVEVFSLLPALPRWIHLAPEQLHNLHGRRFMAEERSTKDHDDEPCTLQSLAQLVNGLVGLGASNESFHIDRVNTKSLSGVINHSLVLVLQRVQQASTSKSDGRGPTAPHKQTNAPQRWPQRGGTQHGWRRGQRSKSALAGPSVEPACSAKPRAHTCPPRSACCPPLSLHWLLLRAPPG